MAEFRSYLFDLYGTLADIRTDEKSRLLWEKTALFYGETGAPYEPRELRARYLALCRAEQERHRDPLYEIELRKVFRALYEEKGRSPSPREADAAALFFRVTSTKKLRLYPWVLPVLRQIRAEGAKAYLLSNAQSCFTRSELRLLGLDALLDGVVISSDAHIRKPSPRILQKLLRDYGVDPASALMTGNEQRSDVAAAHACGIPALYLQTETSAPYDPAFAAERELLDEDYARLPALLGLEHDPLSRR